MMWKWVKALIGVVVAIGLWGTEGYAADKTDLGPPPSERNWQIGFTPSYSSGNYGTNTTSSFFYAPVSIRRFFKDGDVSLVIPFVSATTNGTATLVGGQPTPTLPASCDDNSGSGNAEDRPECQGLGGTGGAQGQKVTNSGLGDIILRGRYYVIEEKDWVPLVAITGRLKLPTADESQGLGTGKMDEGVGTEASKRFGDNWITFLDGGFNIIGRPEGRNLRNQWWYDVGAGYYFTKDLLGSVYFEEYRSLVSGVQNIRDVFFGMNYRASSEWRFNGGIAVGLSNGAPDHVFTVGTSYRF